MYELPFCFQNHYQRKNQINVYKFCFNIGLCLQSTPQNLVLDKRKLRHSCKQLMTVVTAVMKMTIKLLLVALPCSSESSLEFSGELGVISFKLFFLAGLW